jgi:protein TonB
MRNFLLVTLLAQAACANYDIKNDVHHPQYQVAGTDKPESKESAQTTYADALNSRNSKPASSRLDHPLRVLFAPMPDYPQWVRDQRIEGVVDVNFTIEPDGTVSSPSVGGYPHGAFVDLSLNAIRQWKFEPPVRDGKTTRERALQVFTFKVVK